MVEQLELAHHDVIIIAELIDYLILRLMLGSSGGISLYGGGSPKNHEDLQTNLMGYPWEIKQKISLCENDHRDNNNSATFRNFYSSSPSLANLEDLDSVGSENSEIIVMDDDNTSMKSDNTKFVDFNFGGSSKGLSASMTSEVEFGDTYLEHCKWQTIGSISSNAKEGIVINNETRNNNNNSSEIVASTFGATSNNNLMSLTSSCSSLCLVEKDNDFELKVELDAIEAQYEHWFKELSKMKLKALEATRQRWIAKKKLVVL